ncbi:alpha/beta fold hydrolase [Bordetella avium]|uniref:alpha/beta fold hydrolase n=1 Tax=Bordetella avium TaxID=521 RepID=UPI000E6A49B6|nr:alpha/beta fold hydrolase [Bordetella avium]RIQ41144.1 alpha/beta fold hydrolase [Bordetella avium]RIQ46067.1 alpha/beta fold hydrolase [Bordetella avium]RIQ46994.1 alpha/beta fold hydrolase [Bordetella avium]RIQ50586.1 alpha/beta fold hydrolase [Bordetella avium]RIQ75258.1 alpha/beta fold hydrolase [Bordetella avium]
MTRSPHASDLLLVHGAWHGGWCWERVAPLLAAAGRRVVTPTLSGLDGTPGRFGLSHHVDDILAHAGNLGSITLVGHSYAGFPACAAASRLGERIDHLVLLDAFLPVDGEKLLDHAPHLIDRYASAMAADPDWRIPPLPAAQFGISPADQAWVDMRLRGQPAQSYFESIRLQSPLSGCRRTYVRCSQAPGELLARSVSRARNDGWNCLELDAPHDAMISHPQALADLLLDM